MIDQTQLTEASRYCLQHGIRLLQGFRMARTDEEHVRKLLEFMLPEACSYWLDVGSGFGEAARLMRKIRPDLNFLLMNNNQFQIENTPKGFLPVHGDMHSMPFDDNTFDGAMFLYSMCHADDLLNVLRQAARVTRLGGALFIYDYMRLRGSNNLAQAHLASQFYGHEELHAALKLAGWTSARYEYPEGDDTLFRNMVDDDLIYDMIFSEVVPVMIKAVCRAP